MNISNRYILNQGPVIAGLFKAVAAGLKQQILKTESSKPDTPGPEVIKRIPPPPADMVRDYIRHVGGSPSAYRNTLPPHLFPQWGLSVAMQGLFDIDYPLFKVMNGGCRMEINAPLPNDQPLIVRGCLDGIDDDGRRAILRQKVVTGTADNPDALIGFIYGVVPLGSGKKSPTKKKKKDPTRVPQDARELAIWKLGSKAGLDFAKLTGDFNPIHWVAPYARTSGFKNVILHGFSTLARAYEGLNRRLFSGATPIKLFDVQFTKPLVLPARVGLYVDAESHVFVGEAPGGPAYMVGTFETT